MHSSTHSFLSSEPEDKELHYTLGGPQVRKGTGFCKDLNPGSASPQPKLLHWLLSSSSAVPNVWQLAYCTSLRPLCIMASSSGRTFQFNNIWLSPHRKKVLATFCVMPQAHY